MKSSQIIPQDFRDTAANTTIVGFWIIKLMAITLTKAKDINAIHMTEKKESDTS